MKRAAPSGAGRRLPGALVSGLTCLVLFHLPLDAQGPAWENPAGAAGAADYVVLDVAIEGQNAKLIARPGIMATIRQPGGDLHIGLVPRILDRVMGRVEIEVFALQTLRGQPRAARIVRRLDDLNGQVGFTNYVSPIDTGTLVDVTVAYVGSDLSILEGLGVPRQITAANRSSGPPGVTAACCVTCGGVEVCGCAVGMSCGFCCGGCCRN